MSLKKFDEFEYVRPNIDFIESEYKKVIEVIELEEDTEKIFKAIDNINKVRSTFDTMQSLASIRHSINVNDEFYTKEEEFFDEYGPIVIEYQTNYGKALLDCKYLDKLKIKYGEYLFEKIKVDLESFSPEIIEDMQLENKLITQYNKVIASAKIDFDGKILNTSQMMPYLSSSDRKIRKET